MQMIELIMSEPHISQFIELVQKIDKNPIFSSENVENNFKSHLIDANFNNFMSKLYGEF